MKSNKFLQVIILSFSILFSSFAQAENITETEAKLWAEDKGHLLLKAFALDDLKEKYDTLDNLFLSYINLDYISKFVMGKYWRQMDAEQQAQYQSLFKRYALALYKSFPLTFKDNINFEVTEVIVKNNQADVLTEIKVEGGDETSPFNKITVTFRLDKKNTQIKIIDLKLAESSLILSYRNRFYKMMSEVDDDIIWFLEDLETSTLSTEEHNLIKLEEAGY